MTFGDFHPAARSSCVRLDAYATSYSPKHDAVTSPGRAHPVTVNQ